MVIKLVSHQLGEYLKNHPGAAKTLAENLGYTNGWSLHQMLHAGRKITIWLNSKGVAVGLTEQKELKNLTKQELVS